MVLLDKLSVDVLAGPLPDRGLQKLTKLNTQNLNQGVDGDVAKMGTVSGSPVTPVTPWTPTMARKENVWRSVFHPGSNMNTKTLGAHIFDNPTSSSSPTVYDWLYSDESRSRHF